MKLVVTAERYFPAVGGVERVTQRVAEGLAVRGHDVTVVTSGRRSTVVHNGVRVERMPVTGNEVRGIRGDADAALRLIDALAPDLVYNYAAQTWPTDACFAFLERENRPFRLVLTPCGFSALDVPAYARYFAAMRHRLPLYDALIFASSIYRDFEFALQAGADRCFVVPNGADEPAPRRRWTDGPLLVTIGSHFRSKGHADFARAVGAVGRSVTGVIVAPSRTGTQLIRGCQLACLLRSGTSHGRLRVVDGTDPAVAPRALGAADVFLLPSTIECAPLVILEAMAAGVPWVSYDVGNVRELAGGVVVRDFVELVEVTRDLLGEKGRSLGADGRVAWSARHGWASIVDQYECLFTRLVAGDPRLLEATASRRA